MYWEQIADQLHDALRDLYENGANCPDDKVLRARDAYDAACAQLSDEGETQCVWDAPMSKSTAKRVTVLQQARVEELERTVEAWEQCSSDLYRTLQNCGPTGHAAAAVLVQLKANVAELLEKKDGRSYNTI